MKKYFRLCKDKAEMLQFLTDVNTLERVEHTADIYNHWTKENYPAFFCVPKGQQRLGHMPFDDGEVWLKNNGYKVLKPMITPSSREVILTDLQKIFGNIEHLGKNTYYLNGICFYISCMDKDGGVDLKYKEWATDTYLIVSGEGAIKVRDRVIKNYPETKDSVLTFGEFVEKLKGKF